MLNILSKNYPRSLLVRADDRSRYAAVQELTRPSEIEPLLRPPTSAELSIPFVDRVAQWHQVRLRANILRYMPDPTRVDVWQSPRQTLERGGGDCEDLALLLLSVFEHQQIDAVLCTGTYYGRGHAWIEGRDLYSGFHIEATNGTLVRNQRPHGYYAERYYGRGIFDRLAA